MEIFKYLISHGLNINFHYKGLTLLHISVIKGNLELVKYLLKNGANINCLSKHNLTPLDFSIITGNNEIALFLISSGANIYSQNCFGFSLLHFAAITNNYELMKFLLNYNLNINSVDKFHRTPYLLSERNSENQNYLTKCHSNKFITPFLPEGSFNYKQSDLYHIISIIERLFKSQT